MMQGQSSSPKISMTAFGRGPKVVTSPRQTIWSTPVRRMSASLLGLRKMYVCHNEPKKLPMLGQLWVELFHRTPPRPWPYRRKDVIRQRAAEGVRSLVAVGEAAGLR